MVELVFLGAAVISIAMTASVHNKRRFAPCPPLCGNVSFASARTMCGRS